MNNAVKMTEFMSLKMLWTPLWRMYVSKYISFIIELWSCGCGKS